MTASKELEMDFPSPETLLNLGGEVVIVVLFLRYMMSRDSSAQDLENQRHDVLRSMASECHVHSGKITEAFVEAVKESREAIIENTHALGRVHDKLQVQRRREPEQKHEGS